MLEILKISLFSSARTTLSLFKLQESRNALWHVCIIYLFYYFLYFHSKKRSCHALAQYVAVYMINRVNTAYLLEK